MNARLVFFVALSVVGVGALISGEGVGALVALGICYVVLSRFL